MQDFLENFVASFGSAVVAPGLGAAEFFVAVLVAAGLVMIAVSSLLPKSRNEDLEWWER